MGVFHQITDTGDQGSRVGENGLMSLFRYDAIAPRTQGGGAR